MFTNVIVVVDGKIQSIERCELWIFVIIIYGSCRIGGCVRLAEDDADASKYVGVLTTYKMLIIYICCVLVGLYNKQNTTIFPRRDLLF
jgi:hypothetical protein